MSYHEEIETIHKKILELREILEQSHKYKYKVVLIEEDDSQLEDKLEYALNYWSTQGWYYGDMIFMGQQWILILEKEVKDA